MLRFGTIGSGWIVHEYVEGAKNSGLWELAAIYSRTRERGEEFAAQHGAEHVFTDVEDLAASPEIDAVYVASPNAFHYRHCKILLEHGKHVICEKPVCAQAEKVMELQEIARTKQVVFLEAIMYLHQPQRKLLEEALGKIGKLTLAKLDFCQRSSKLDAYLGGSLPNIFNPALETGALMDLGVYCVYPALSLFGSPDSFHVDSYQMKSGADGGGVITMKYPDKLVTLTYSKLGESGENTEFQGTEGTVTVDSISRLAEIVLRPHGGEPKKLYGSDAKSLLMGREAADFYRYITQPEKTKAEYEQCSALSLETARFMEAVRMQAGIRFPCDN